MVENQQRKTAHTPIIWPEGTDSTPLVLDTNHIIYKKKLHLKRSEKDTKLASFLSALQEYIAPSLLLGKQYPERKDTLVLGLDTAVVNYTREPVIMYLKMDTNI